MSVYMRAVLFEWHEPPFDEIVAFVAGHGSFRVQPVGDREWMEFEVVNAAGTTVLAADLMTGSDAREEMEELLEFVDELDGPDSARELVESHLRTAEAVVGMQVIMSVYDDSVAAANAIIDYLERRPGVLTQVDTVGWYDGPELILREPD
jgi:hypothetical protein